MAINLGVPLKLLKEFLGDTITVEATVGDIYKGKLFEVEENMSVHLKDVNATFNDEKTFKMKYVYIRGSRIRLISLPEYAALDALETLKRTSSKDGRGSFRGGRVGGGNRETGAGRRDGRRRDDGAERRDSGRRDGGTGRRDSGRRDGGTGRRDSGRRDGGTGRRDSGRRDDGAGRRDDGAGRRDDGAGRRDDGAGRRDDGAGRRDGGRRDGDSGRRDGDSGRRDGGINPLYDRRRY